MAVVDTNEIYRNTSTSFEQPLRAPNTPPYQRLTKALKCDARCGHEVTIGRRIGLYKFCGDIGRGNFSKVKLAMHQLTRDKVAIKVVDRSCLDTKASQMLSSEIATLECVYHPHILRLFEVVETMERVYLVTEWVRGGELYNHIIQNGPITEVRSAYLFKQLVEAVKHMHTLGFVHRDIKAENVLLLSEDRLKLADFGFSTQLTNGATQKLHTFCGSPPYAAPELFSDDHYVGAAVDVWALGILLYFMVVGNMPFRAPNIPCLKAAILKGDYMLPGQLSMPCIRLIQRILVHSAAHRPTIDDILNCQFLLYPKLSEKLLEIENNTLSKNNTWSFLMGRKTQRLRKTQSLNEHYVDKQIKPAIIGNTKHNEGVFVKNFLHPIEMRSYLSHELLKETNKFDTPKRVSLLYDSICRKISPMELEKSNHQFINADMQAHWHVDLTVENAHLEKYDWHKNNYLMLPTNTVDQSQLATLEYEAREILQVLGITSKMLIDAAPNGPRSDIIGTYRIVINRLQKQASLSRKNGELALQKLTQTNKKTRNSCCIL